jgi:glutamate-5-semialdehyde dehydrogenase
VAQVQVGDDPARQVRDAATGARNAAASLASAADGSIDVALRGMAEMLGMREDAILEANRADEDDAVAAGMGVGLLDRLRLNRSRLEAAAGQLRALADLRTPPTRNTVRLLPGGLVLQEWHRPVGVIGANFEARPNVVLDLAGQLLRSRNAGVLRTGGAALRSAIALVDQVVGPSLAAAGLDPAAVGLVREPTHAGAAALVTMPDLVPLVILRGSGESTRALAELAARHGVRTLAHADGGAVLFLDRAADTGLALEIVRRSLDRLGVCNRLNLLLVDESRWDELVPAVTSVLAELDPPVAVSLPPHAHPIGQEWALCGGAEATVTVSPAVSAQHAARIANDETSGLAAGIVTSDAQAATDFLTAYTGTGAFWNASSRLLDGYRLFSIPETGINIDRVPGPRGPVTFRDLYLRQYVVVPAAADDVAGEVSVTSS